MKKMFLTYSILAALAITSCKDKTTAASAVNAKTETTTEEATTSKTGIPTFSDSNIQNYITSYDAYIEEYRNAAENKDMTALAGLAEKGQDLATQFQNFNGNLSTSDTEKLNTYVTEKAKELQEISKKMME